MGKSKPACFRIIGCGGDSVEHDDLQTPECVTEANVDLVFLVAVVAFLGSFTGASFEMSSRLIIEQKEEKTIEILQKEETATEILQKEEKTTEIPQKEEKTTEILQKEERIELPCLVSQASRENDLGADAPPDEHCIILIQTAVRGLLARRYLLKQKSATKLQAVVRGHIVRSHAVGTLRCVQAIIKMQALVRAHHPRLQNKKEAKASQPHTYVSIEKLLSNAFARQLMEASPRTKPTNIKCDPSKPDSAWTWLERWMSVSSVSNEEPHETEAVVEKQKDNLGHPGRNEEYPSVQIIPLSTDSESCLNASDDVSNDNKMTKYDASILDVHLQNSDQSDPKCEMQESSPAEIKKTDLVDVMEESQNEEVQNEVMEVDYFLKKEETGIVQEAPDCEKFSSMQPETEVKLISRKASNPAFIAAQSKFEELSLAAPSAKLDTSSGQDPGIESSLDKVSSANQDQLFRSGDKDSGVVGHPTSNASAVQLGSSEYGTELSTYSTLDSPDRSEEARVRDSETKRNVSDETDAPRNGENLKLEAKSVVLETDPSSNNTTKLERNGSVDSVSEESLNSCVPADTPQLEKPEDLKQSETSHRGNKSSPEASPRKNGATPELLATPSSQGSVKRKKSKGEKSQSNRKSKPLSDDKNPSNHTPGSASRSSLDQLQEHKSGNRRNSIWFAKPDHKEQDPRDSSSRNSLPSYMQATESARAKTTANGSPRSSPDVHDKEIYIKKRHSLPGTDERQGSPRIHRSLSQTQQNTKGNASHSPQGIVNIHASCDITSFPQAGKHSQVSLDCSYFKFLVMPTT
ncbi:LOW QUALITY PROTEIN: protein IQ-DOMAIN 32-like [Salvia hispanica]|uniref:LOW QUALITY PROTEIN: protein IQ-DOMAIN 32-like n=1 Tax=Salvia hispanica TaxID=49212 RepID=UPI0020090D7E|nr:LOW QUALITY PROTEIN: protein IQ-DOMAIN 32-like [Salvia hispanica]